MDNVSICENPDVQDDSSFAGPLAETSMNNLSDNTKEVNVPIKYNDIDPFRSYVDDLINLNGNVWRDRHELFDEQSYRIALRKYMALYDSVHHGIPERLRIGTRLMNLDSTKEISGVDIGVVYGSPLSTVGFKSIITRSRVVTIILDGYEDSLDYTASFHERAAEQYACIGKFVVNEDCEVGGYTMHNVVASLDGGPFFRIADVARLMGVEESYFLELDADGYHVSLPFVPIGDTDTLFVLQQFELSEFLRTNTVVDGFTGEFLVELEVAYYMTVSRLDPRRYLDPGYDSSEEVEVAEEATESTGGHVNQPSVDDDERDERSRIAYEIARFIEIVPSDELSGALYADQLRESGDLLDDRYDSVSVYEYEEDVYSETTEVEEPSNRCMLERFVRSSFYQRFRACLMDFCDFITCGGCGLR